MAEGQDTPSVPARQPLSKRLRFEVFKRDDFICQYCGAHPPDVVLEVDHITPVAEGGGSESDNLITACFNCNRGKAAIPLSVMPQSLPEKAAQIAEAEAQLAGYRDVLRARDERIESDVWEVVEILFPPIATEKLSIRKDWFKSIKIFNDRLPLEIVKEAAEISYLRGPRGERRLFLYFCKVCWNIIKESRSENLPPIERASNG